MEKSEFLNEDDSVNVENLVFGIQFFSDSIIIKLTQGFKDLKTVQAGKEMFDDFVEQAENEINPLPDEIKTVLKNSQDTLEAAVAFLTVKEALQTTFGKHSKDYPLDYQVSELKAFAKALTFASEIIKLDEMREKHNESIS